MHHYFGPLNQAHAVHMSDMPKAELVELASLLGRALGAAPIRITDRP